ncbi:hypothetical protein Patl1_20650 [Pistacia atlantica]|uniref:Uncharacterized protein n=1 Tax=Pistacia atlantica TaxID=434234 RepID=A0ACC1BIA9_9ROSI|nr:hypothetical protein Patl1_20650 [Pistacia atlantica]
MKTESGVQKRKVDHSCCTSKKEMIDLAFLLWEESLDNHPSAFRQLLYWPITRDVMLELDPAESSSNQTFRTCEWKSRNTIIKAEPKFDEVEGLVKQEQQVNLYQDRDLNRKWAALQDSALLVHLHGEKVRYSALAILRILAKDIDDEKTDFFAELSHRNLVKPFAYCWEDKWLLHVCLFVQKESLENCHFKKYPTIEPLSWEKPFKIHSGAAGRLTALHSLKKLDIHQTFKVPSILLDGTAKGLLAQTPNSMDARDFTAVDISPFLLHGKKDMEVKNTPPRAWARRATDVFEKTFQWWHHQPNLSNTQTMKDHKFLSNSRHLLLLTSTLLATVSLHAALKMSRCRVEEGYDSRLNSIFQTETHSNRLLILFNSLTFFLSVALMMRLFNKLPFRPWLLVSLFSMIGAYMCIMMYPVKPCTFPS